MKKSSVFLLLFVITSLSVSNGRKSVNREKFLRLLVEKEKEYEHRKSKTEDISTMSSIEPECKVQILYKVHCITRL